MRIRNPRQGWHKNSAGDFIGFFGPFEILIEYNEDACWTYTVGYGCWVMREFGDYEKSLGTAEKAKEAAVKWLSKQTQWALTSLQRKG